LGTFQPVAGNFYVTGLPRSRTTWAANLLTYGGRYCYQDAFLNCATPEQVLDVIGNGNGLSDPMFLLCWRRVLAVRPAPIAVIVRDFAAVCEASKKAFTLFNMEFMVRLQQEMLMLCRQPGVLTLDYNEPKLAEQLWQHCRRGEPFDVIRGQMLDGMNVQAIIDTSVDSRIDELLSEVW
jgi:hypothetical protein